MGLFKKKQTGDEAVLQNKAQIERNVRTLYVVLAQLEGNKEIADKLKDLAEAYKYASPFGAPDAAKADGKIADRIDDMKAAAVKAADNKDFGEIENLIRRIKVLIAERGVISR